MAILWNSICWNFIVLNSHGHTEVTKGGINKWDLKFLYRTNMLMIV